MISDLIHTLTGYFSVISVFLFSFIPANTAVKGIESPIIIKPQVVQSVTVSPTLKPLKLNVTPTPIENFQPSGPLTPTTTINIEDENLIIPTYTPLPSQISSTITPSLIPTLIPSLTPTRTPTLKPTIVPTKILPSPGTIQSPASTDTRLYLSTPDARRYPASPTLSPTIVPTFPPVPTPSAPAIKSLNAGLIFDMVNGHRIKLGLPVFRKDDLTCQIAAYRTPQVYDEIFVTYKFHAGFYALHLPYWSTENIIYHDTEQDAVDWWIGDEGHRKIIEGDYKYSCVSCYGYACSQVFTSYILR